MYVLEYSCTSIRTYDPTAPTPTAPTPSDDSLSDDDFDDDLDDLAPWGEAPCSS